MSDVLKVSPRRMLPALAAVAILQLLTPARLPVAAAQSSAFRKKVDARLDAAPFNRQLWGIALVDEKGKLLYDRNADRLFIPASNTKLVVSAVAAALLPPDFTVRTSVYAAGPVVNGVVQGDLVGVANRDLKANEPGALATKGVFDFDKAASGGSAIAAGATVYWDNTANVATTTAAGNKRIGPTIKAAADADPKVRALLAP